jgi:hypothetical protein
MRGWADTRDGSVEEAIGAAGGDDSMVGDSTAGDSTGGATTAGGGVGGNTSGISRSGRDVERDADCSSADGSGSASGVRC